MSAPPSQPNPLGVHPRGDGVAVAILAAHAERVEFCLLDEAPGGGWAERRIELANRTHGVWHDVIADVPIGQRYGIRVHGEWNPRHGLRHNSAKLLLDPYARAVVPPARLRPELYGHVVNDELHGSTRLQDNRDSAPYAAHAVLVESPLAYDPTASTRLFVPWADSVIYEAHVRGLTKRLPHLPEHLRGTYAGLAHPVTIEYLLGLGVTALELLPVQASMEETHLARRGLANYWGYSTLGFFAPHLAYSAAQNAAGAVVEFREMVAALHAAGLEVILDVVYNHTCESGVAGPTLSFRGLDAPTYYRLDGDGRDVDFTGCGNSLDATHTRVVQLVLDSLRYWVQAMDVDGFRFDLAPTLARGRNEFHADHPMLVAMRIDPVLADVKLIAEPWDVGPDGWRTGQFPPPFAEWNDRFRDDVREFWLPGAARAAAGQHSGGLRDLGTRIAGSADTFNDSRGPLASINFVTAHDGFTLADAVAYNHKHNLGNGEDNRDGTDNNRSWNHGAEGATDDHAILSARRRAHRNLLATLLLSAGVPMLLGGDEFGRTQAGNNNPYAQDNDVSWVDWQREPWQDDLLETTRYLLALRRRFAAVRAERFFLGRPPEGSAAPDLKDLNWYAPDGTEMTWQHWEDPGLRTLQVLLADPALVGRPPRGSGFHDTTQTTGDGGAAGSGSGSLLMVIAGAASRTEIVLPAAPSVTGYEKLWNSSHDRPPTARPRLLKPGAKVTLPADSLLLYRARNATT